MHVQKTNLNASYRLVRTDAQNSSSAGTSSFDVVVICAFELQAPKTTRAAAFSRISS